MLPFPQQVPTIFSPSHSINLNLLPTSGNSASTGAVATFAGSGPSGRKAAECASCCELVGPQYIQGTSSCFSGWAHQTNGGSWKPSATQVSRFPSWKKIMWQKEEVQRLMYLLFLCRIIAWWACGNVMSQFCFDRLMWLVWSMCLGSEVVFYTSWILHFLLHPVWYVVFAVSGKYATVSK